MAGLEDLKRRLAVAAGKRAIKKTIEKAKKAVEGLLEQEEEENPDAARKAANAERLSRLGRLPTRDSEEEP
ncbi:MAG: hypothetical protein HN348_26750 [Proteobacteria bacterium]|nr:hypothetical protein [Pseudomonadota bacterium]